MRVDADLCRWCTACRPLLAFDRAPAKRAAAATLPLICQPCARCSFPAPPIFFFETRPSSYYQFDLSH